MIPIIERFLVAYLFAPYAAYLVYTEKIPETCQESVIIALKIVVAAFIFVLGIMWHPKHKLEIPAETVSKIKNYILKPKEQPV